jgi:hypothetical protein
LDIKEIHYLASGLMAMIQSKSPAQIWKGLALPAKEPDGSPHWMVIITLRLQGGIKKEIDIEYRNEIIENIISIIIIIIIIFSFYLGMTLDCKFITASVYAFVEAVFKFRLLPKDPVCFLNCCYVKPIIINILLFF